MLSLSLLFRAVWEQREHHGLIRQYFPKVTDFRKVTDAELGKVVNKLNGRPRKRLSYRTPAQVFLGEYSSALVAADAALLLEFRITRLPFAKGWIAIWQSQSGHPS